METREARIANLEQELSAIDIELERLTAAIAAGGALSALLEAMKEREANRTRLRAQFAALRSDLAVAQKGVNPVQDCVRRVLSDWRGVLRRQIPQARQIVAKLDGRLAITPEHVDGVRGFRVAGSGCFLKFCEAVFSATGQFRSLDRGAIRSMFTGVPQAVASPTGFDRFPCGR